MSPITGFDNDEVSGVLRGYTFHGGVGAEGACSRLRGDWEGRRGGHVAKPTWTGKGGDLWGGS